MTAEELNLKDGEYTAEVTMEGGSGRATIDSPTDISVKDGKVTAITGKEVAIEADSICVHGDGAKALEFVEKIREAFAKEGIQISSLDEFVK